MLSRIRGRWRDPDPTLQKNITGALKPLRAARSQRSSPTRGAYSKHGELVDCSHNQDAKEDRGGSSLTGTGRSWWSCGALWPKNKGSGDWQMIDTACCCQLCTMARSRAPSNGHTTYLTLWFLHPQPIKKKLWRLHMYDFKNSSNGQN